MSIIYRSIISILKVAINNKIKIKIIGISKLVSSSYVRVLLKTNYLFHVQFNSVDKITWWKIAITNDNFKEFWQI